ncbi:MAG TPA: ABC transporter substrate-binding protein [Candidatus Binatia bacterium]|nr:ABC transporter substrate-binding protein [Candidatus Binatia bacterium]
MSEYQPLEIRGFYRSHSHLPIWEVMEKTGIWEQVGLKVSFEFCDSSSAAEKALFDGTVDFVSGNHISPYLLVRRGRPIVSLTSPSNSVNDKLVARFPIREVTELRGKRIGDTTLVDSIGGYHHPRGNHMLYIMRSGLRLNEVEWVELTESNKEFHAMQLDVLKSGKVDAIFVTGNTDKFDQAGLHVVALDRLPMINGPTLTSTLSTLQRKDRLGERLVKAQVLGIHFARTHRGETEKILEGLRQRVPQASNVNYRSVSKLLPKPYPDHEAVANAYRLCCMKTPETEEMSPLALWDLHYLRELDNSGFIDALYQSN